MKQTAIAKARSVESTQEQPQEQTRQRGIRGSEWVAILRSLAILKRLMAGPATNEQLIQSVLDTLGANAYSPESSAQLHALKHDRGNLKKRLGADYDFD